MDFRTIYESFISTLTGSSVDLFIWNLWRHIYLYLKKNEMINNLTVYSPPLSCVYFVRFKASSHFSPISHFYQLSILTPKKRNTRRKKEDTDLTLSWNFNGDAHHWLGRQTETPIFVWGFQSKKKIDFSIELFYHTNLL